MFEIEISDLGDYTLCRPAGELDAYTVGQFREALGEVKARTSGGPMIGLYAFCR